MTADSRRIHIEYYDLERLQMLLKSQGDLSRPGCESLNELASYLEDAVIIRPGMPVPLVITMNSSIRLQNEDTGDVTQYRLVFPGKSSKGLGKLSVLTPLGASVLGRRELDSFSVVTPSGEERYRIAEIVRQRAAEGVLVG